MQKEFTVAPQALRNNHSLYLSADPFHTKGSTFYTHREMCPTLLVSALSQFPDYIDFQRSPRSGGLEPNGGGLGKEL